MMFVRLIHRFGMSWVEWFKMVFREGIARDVKERREQAVLTAQQRYRQRQMRHENPVQQPLDQKRQTQHENPVQQPLDRKRQMQHEKIVRRSEHRKLQGVPLKPAHPASIQIVSRPRKHSNRRQRIPCDSCHGPRPKPYHHSCHPFLPPGYS